MSETKAVTFRSNISNPTVCGCKFFDYRYKTSDPIEIGKLRNKILFSVDSVQVFEEVVPMMVDNTPKNPTGMNIDADSDMIIKAVNECKTAEELGRKLQEFARLFPDERHFTENQLLAINLTTKTKRLSFTEENKGKNKGKNKGA